MASELEVQIFILAASYAAVKNCMSICKNSSSDGAKRTTLKITEMLAIAHYTGYPSNLGCILITCLSKPQTGMETRHTFESLHESDTYFKQIHFDTKNADTVLTVLRQRPDHIK